MPTVEGNEMWNECDFRAEFLFDLRKIPVFRYAVGARALVAFAEEKVFGRFPAGPLTPLMLEAIIESGWMSC